MAVRAVEWQFWSLVNKAHSQIRLDTTLQGMAVRVSLHKTLSVGSLYLSPGSALDKNKLMCLINQLPRPAIVLGDFNAHNPLWGSAKISPRGKQIEEIIASNDLSLVNDGSIT